MADINSPKEFLTELLTAVDSLDADKAEYSKLSENLKSLESSLETLKKNVLKEKNDTVNSRQNDLSSGFDKQIKAAKAELKTANDKRQKALNTGMTKKTMEATKGVKQENEGFKEAFSTYAKTNKLPYILRTRAYYMLFCPGLAGYIIYLGIFLIIMFLCGTMIKSRGASGEPVGPFVFIGIIAIIIFFVYIIIWANTRVRYRDEIKSCLNIVKSIRNNEKNVKKIEKTIKKAGDDNTYDLQEFDGEISAKEQQLSEIELKKKQALAQFENETAVRLRADIDEAHKNDMDDLGAKITAANAEIKSALSRINDAETNINDNFISYVGAKNLNHEKIAEMIKMIDEGGAASVSEAVSKLG